LARLTAKRRASSVVSRLAAIVAPLHISGTFDLLTFEPPFFLFFAAFFAAFLSAFFAIFRNLLCLIMMLSISQLP
jgi:hypothetical protein